MEVLFEVEDPILEFLTISIFFVGVAAEKRLKDGRSNYMKVDMRKYIDTKVVESFKLGGIEGVRHSPGLNPDLKGRHKFPI